ncbi:MAG: universal stress protein [Planctomycetes bacterium]|nr:universal stress protein [Planctomycetota bacterium]
MNIHIRRILLPTDFSSPSQEAKRYAIDFASRFDAELHLLYVLPIVTPFAEASPTWTMPEQEQKRQISDAEKRLKLEIDPDVQGKAITAVVQVGFAVDEIVKYVNQNNIDLIVMGTHGHSGLSHFLIGSVAEKIVRIATCPVLTVHPREVAVNK